MKKQIRKALADAGFSGQVIFEKHSEFGEHNPSHGPAMHRRWLADSCEAQNLAEGAERDNFTTIVIYLEPKSYYVALANLSSPKHVWTKGEIDGLRKNLGYSSNWSTAARESLTEELVRNGFAQPFRITPEQTKFGIEWLRETQLRKTGQLRTTAFVGEREAEVIRKFKQFQFVGLSFENFNYHSQTYQTISPVYRTIAKNGKWFEYTAHAFAGFEVTDGGEL